MSSMPYTNNTGAVFIYAVCVLLLERMPSEGKYSSMYTSYASDDFVLTCVLFPPQDWKEHKKLCKIVRKGVEAKARADVSPSTGAAVEETSQSPAKDEPVQEVLGEWTSNIEATKRLERGLSDHFQKYGNGFSKWWSEMSSNEKKRLVLDVTDDTIPLLEPSPQEISNMLRAADHGMSPALFDYNIASLCGSGNNDGKLLKEMTEWAQNAEKKDEENIRISTVFCREGVFPNTFGGELAVVIPPTKDEPMSDPLVFNDSCPPDVLQQYRQHIEQGLMYDACAVQYATGRKIYSLRLFAKLFDEYSMRIRRVPSINPMERLSGCNRCFRSCQMESSKQCQVCKACWFCSQACMVAAGHVPCPHNMAFESKAVFK